MYQLILKSLLPPGHFWEVKRGSAFDILLKTLGKPLEKVALYANVVFDKLEATPDEIGNLSRSYVHSKLLERGYKDFEIEDPTEREQSIEPVNRSSELGQIYVQLAPIIQYFRVGSPAGSPLREWANTDFESDLKSLIPATVTPNFIYKELENAETR